jgi:PAS domain S-box-containing protein
VVLSESQLPAVRDYLAMAPKARSSSQPERDLQGIMQNWALRDSRASSYLLLDKQGVVALSTSSLDIGKDLSATGYFQQAMSSGQSIVSDVLFQPKAQAGEIDFSVAVIDASHNFAGVLVARFATRLLQDLVSQTNGLAGSQSYGVLYDNNLLQLADGTDATADFKLVAPVTPLYLADLQRLNRVPQLSDAYQYSLKRPDLASPLAAMLAPNSTAAPYFTAEDALGSGHINQVAVTNLNSKPWLLAFFQPRDVFLAPVQRQTSTTLTLAALIAVIVTAGAVLAAQVLTDPLTRLTGTADKVAAGDLSVRAEVLSRDEIGTLAATFNSMTGRLSEMIGTLESRVAERTAQLQAAADIGRATASVRSLDELLRLSLDLIRDRFGFYHASLFLIDEASRAAVLRESTGVVGAQLKARGHKLGIGSQSLIGWVTENRRPRVAVDVADDPYHFRNPLLPDTRSELAIPLIVGERLLGALDVQSTQANAFGAGDVQVLQTLADQIAIAIRNAQQLSATQRAQNFLDSVIENLPVTLFVKDAADLKYVRWNRASEELLGYTRAERVGKSDYDLYAADSAAVPASDDRLVLHNKDLVDIPEEPVGTRTRGTRVLHTRKIPILDDAAEPQFLLGISEDITERKEAEQALRTAEERYRSLVEQLPAVIYANEVPAGQATSRATYISPQVQSLLGYNPEEWLADPNLWIKLLHPDDREAVLREVAHQNTTGAPLDIKYRSLTRDGRGVVPQPGPGHLRPGRRHAHRARHHVRHHRSQAGRDRPASGSTDRPAARATAGGGGRHRPRHDRLAGSRRAAAHRRQSHPRAVRLLSCLDLHRGARRGPGRAARINRRGRARAESPPSPIGRGRPLAGGRRHGRPRAGGGARRDRRPHPLEEPAAARNARRGRHSTAERRQCGGRAGRAEHPAAKLWHGRYRHPGDDRRPTGGGPAERPAIRPDGPPGPPREPGG